MSIALQPLWKIEDDLQALLDSVETCPEELKPELEQKIRQYMGDAVIKLDNIQAAWNRIAAQISAAEAEIDRLKERKKQAQSAQDKLEAYLVRILEKRNGEPLKGRNITYSLRHSEAVVIQEPDKIPQQYKRTTVTVDIDKNAIKKAIKAGEEIDGCDLEYRSSLQIK